MGANCNATPPLLKEILMTTDLTWPKIPPRQNLMGANCNIVDPVHLFLSLSSESEFRQKPPPIALSAVACININLW